MEPKHCASCHKLLKGLFYQGYQCTKCQTGVHRDCILGLPTCGMLRPPQLPPRPQDFNRISIPLPIPIPLDTKNGDTEESDVSLHPNTPRQDSKKSLMSINGNTDSSLVPPSMPPPPFDVIR